MACPCRNNPNLTSTTPCSTGCSTGCTPCKSTATICHFVVDTIEEARMYKNSYVVVTGEGNAVYHIGADGNPLTVNKPAIEDPNHVATVGAHTSTDVYDYVNKKHIHYMSDGTFITFTGV